MKVGDISIDVVTDGTLLLDGGALFGPVPKIQWEKNLKPDRSNRVRISLNSILIQLGSQNILIDTGVGAKRMEKLKESYGAAGNKLIKNLKREGLTARDIDTVVLTDLRFHRAGGCTKVDRVGQTLPAFPKAKYLVQRAALEQANNPSERGAPLYYKDDVSPLMEKDLLEVIDGNHKIAPGITTFMTDGPSIGHQVVLIESGSERIAYAGDLMPTSYHLAPGCISSLDYSPNKTLIAKREVLSMALDKGWLLVFGNAQENYAGYVEQRGGRYGLRPIDI